MEFHQHALERAQSEHSSNYYENTFLGASYLHNHLRKFGLLMHVGNGAVLSKTEAMYFPPPRVEYSAADTSRIDVLNVSEVPVGSIDFTTELSSWFYCALFSQFRRGSR